MTSGEISHRILPMMFWAHHGNPEEQGDILYFEVHRRIGIDRCKLRNAYTCSFMQGFIVSRVVCVPLQTHSCCWLRIS